MSSTYSPDLRIELIGTGDQAGVWGSTTNNNLTYVLEQAIAGYVSVSVTSAAQALTYLNGASAVAADNQAVHASLALTTTTSANFAVYAPPASKQFTIYNASAYIATIYNSTVIGNTTAAGTGVAIPAGKTMTVWSDGTNFTQQNTHLISPTIATPTFTAPVLGTPASGNLSNCTNVSLSGSVTGVLPVANGGTGSTTASTGTGGVVLSNSPTLVTPILGTPASGNLSNCTNISLTGGVTGILPIANGGVGTASFTGTGNNVFSNSPTLVTPALGTPSSGNLANCTFPTLNQNTTGNAATATSPQSGGSFITTSNIASQSVNFANSATNATNATNATTAASCSGNSATATNATNATNAANLITTNFSVFQSGSTLIIQYAGSTIFTISSGGNLSVTGTVTANG